MGVVINEFEVVSENQPAEGPAGAAAAPPPEAATPHDLERIIQRRAERAERVWAH
jgi:hypothetical protein